MKGTTGQRIRKLRKERGWTQEQLAEKCGVASFKAVIRWEHDYALPSTNSLDRLSRVFNVSIEEILRGEKNENRK